MGLIDEDDTTMMGCRLQDRREEGLLGCCSDQCEKRERRIRTYYMQSNPMERRRDEEKRNQRVEMDWECAGKDSHGAPGPGSAS
jgi:hypothetical protein